MPPIPVRPTFFTFVVDYQHLLPILNEQTSDMVDNPRLQRLKAKLGMYVFSTDWGKSTDHAITDMLSRAPVREPTTEDDALASEVQLHVRATTCHAMDNLSICRATALDTTATCDLIIAHLESAVSEDSEYMDRIQALTQGFPRSSDRLTGELRHFWKLQRNLSVDATYFFTTPAS